MRLYHGSKSGRRTKNRRGDVVAAMDGACLKHKAEVLP